MKTLPLVIVMALALLVPCLGRSQNTDSITIVSPARDANFARGETYTISWRVSTANTNISMVVSLQNPFGYTGYTDAPLMLSTNAVGSVTFKVPQDQYLFPNGTYFVNITPVDDTVKLESPVFHFNLVQKQLALNK
jgi:hypothetical protein